MLSRLRRTVLSHLVFPLKKLVASKHRAYANTDDLRMIARLANPNSQNIVTVPVEVRESALGEGQQGVFATEAIPAGELITLYPGWCFPFPEHLVMAAVAAAEEGSTATAACTRSSSDIDIIGEFAINKDLPLSNIYIMNSLFGGVLDSCEHWEYSERYCGHRVNHPPKAVSPNVELAHFKWQQVLDFAAAAREGDGGKEVPLLELQHILRINRMFEGPLLWYRNTMTGKETMLPASPSLQLLNGVALYASKDISPNEEILLDYDLSAEGAALHDWYHPCISPA